MRGVEMLGRMLVRRLVAATDVAAGETKAQMHPLIAGPQAILAAIGAWAYGANLIEMPAGIHGEISIERWREVRKLGAQAGHQSTHARGIRNDNLRASSRFGTKNCNPMRTEVYDRVIGPGAIRPRP